MRLLGYTCTSVHALEFSNINVLSKLKACYYTSKTLMFKNCVSSNKWTMFFFVAGKNMRNVARWNWSAKSSASGYYSYWWEGKSLWRGKVIIPCGMQTHYTCANGQLQKQKRESSKSCLCGFHSSAFSCLAHRGALVLLDECLGCDQVGCCGCMGQL